MELDGVHRERRKNSFANLYHLRSFFSLGKQPVNPKTYDVAVAMLAISMNSVSVIEKLKYCGTLNENSLGTSRHALNDFTRRHCSLGTNKHKP